MTNVARTDRDRDDVAVPETVASPAGGSTAAGRGSAPDSATSSDAGVSPGAEASAPESLGPPAASRRWRNALALATLAFAILVLPLGLAVGITAGAAIGTPATARVVNATELEAEYGIKVDLVAVIAAGGLVNVRFTVLDAAKAGHLLHDTTELPALYLADRNAVLRTSQAKAHKMTILDGGSYFLLYPNSGGLVQAGTPVSIVIDSVRLAPIDAQS